MTIAEIFAIKGEPTFRQLEHSLTEELKETGGMVLAPGGGWVTRLDTVALLRPPSRMVYLRVRPRTAIARMGRSGGRQAAAESAEPVAELERLLNERRIAYEASDYVVDVERVAISEVVRRIVAALRS
jgi:shikimate kinase